MWRARFGQATHLYFYPMKSPVPFHSLSALLAASALLLAACGQSNSSNNAASSASTAAAPATPASPATAPANVDQKTLAAQLDALRRQNDFATLKGKTIHLAFIPKGMENTYWKSVKKGIDAAQKEAQDAGINVAVDWQGPPNESDRQAQIGLVETYVAQKLDGIILCPMDSKALVAPSDKARHAGIPLVIVDSSLDYSDIVAFVGTNNRSAGELAGSELAQELGDKGNVILMRFLAGSASTTDREEGFLDEMKKHPGIQILSSDNYAGDDAAKALAKGADLLNTYKGQVDGVFTPNEPSTNGMLKALENAGLAGKVKFVGFDGDKTNMDGMNNGEIGAIVLQYPYQMGYLGVKAMLAHLAGQTIPANVDTGTVVLRKDNQTDPAVKALLDNTVQQ
jgi:ribose transport system substrate-binding protein